MPLEPWLTPCVTAEGARLRILFWQGQLGEPFLTRPTASGWQWIQVNLTGGDVAPGPITQVACGRNHSLCIKGGVVYAWGCNDGLQCGASPVLQSATRPRLRERLAAQLGGPAYNFDAEARACTRWLRDGPRYSFPIWLESSTHC